MQTTTNKPVTLRDIQARDKGMSWRKAEVGAIDAEARTVELAFSSEAEVARWWGIEVLSHDPAAVDLSRLNDGGALLMDHDPTDQVGVVESASVDADKRGRAVVRFGRSKRASEVFQDVVDGIRKHISVGYAINAMQLTEERENGDLVYTITSWLPCEISFVSIPADASVGVGRAMENPHIDLPTTQPENSDKQENVNTHKEIRNMPDTTQETQAIDADAVRRAGSDAERARVKEIIEMGEQYGAAELARDFVKDGKTAGEFQRALLQHIEQRQSRPLSEQTADAAVGLTDKEIGQYRFMNVVRALANPHDKKAQNAAAFEIEAGRAAADKAGKEAKGIMVPAEVLSRDMFGRRSFNAGTNGQTGAGSTGGNAIATELMASAFVDLLRNSTTIMQLGRTLGGLVGNVDIPKKTARSQGYWLGEGDDAHEGDIDLGQISLSPKTVAAYMDATRRLMQQSSLDVEALMRADLAEALGLAIDYAGYYGSGSDFQPKGLANYTGISAVPFAATTPSYAEVVAMETAIASKNAAVQNMAYVVNATTKGAAKTTQKFPGTPTGATLWEQGDTMNGYGTRVTNQLQGGDVFFGNFSDLIIAMWGGLDLTVDVSSLSKSGGTRIVVFQDVDFAARRVESFALGRKPA